MGRNRTLGSPYEIQTVTESVTTQSQTDQYNVNAVPLTLTLDPQAFQGDQVVIADVTGEASTQPITILPSPGQSIVGVVAGNLQLSEDFGAIVLTFDGPSQSWTAFFSSSATSTNSSYDFGNGSLGDVTISTDQPNFGGLLQYASLKVEAGVTCTAVDPLCGIIILSQTVIDIAGTLDTTGSFPGDQALLNTGSRARAVLRARRAATARRASRTVTRRSSCSSTSSSTGDGASSLPQEGLGSTEDRAASAERAASVGAVPGGREAMEVRAARAGPERAPSCSSRPPSSSAPRRPCAPMA